ncbi:MAG: DUF4097 family beta strand repeat protein [Oscillospiraceae bacterium]|nr:DUF4097 family beta strand repeat protein [Oscillospiraceae bacterium]
MNRAVNIWLIVTAVLSLIFGGCLWCFRDSKGTAQYHEGRNTVELCDNIELDMIKTDVELIPYDGEELLFEYKSTVPISVLKGDNRLVVKESDEFLLSFFTGDESQFGFKLYLPRQIYKSITIYNSSGDVYIGRIDSDLVTAVTKSGEIFATDTRSLMKLTSGSGDILLDFESVVADSSISTRYGNAEILFPAGSSVALSYETVSGSFECTMLSGSIEGSYMYSFRGGNNLIRADVETGILTVKEK